MEYAAVLTLDVTNLNDTQKERLRGAIKFFTGDRNNMPIQIINGDRKDMAGGILMTKEILAEFQELIGPENAKIVSQ